MTNQKFNLVKKLTSTNKFKYSGSNKLILDNIKFSIDAGSIIGNIGESGSGKLILINLLLGLLKTH